ncbi:MAG: ABCB family ABC transporter ATP-binding protein/permease [Pseudomonadales bacterium]
MNAHNTKADSHPTADVVTESEQSRAQLWPTLRRLGPWLWVYRKRILIAALCLVLAKVANVLVPVLLKAIVDHLTSADGTGVITLTAIVPTLLVVAYGVLRVSGTIFNELRNALFARVGQRAARSVALTVFEHLQGLSLAFHLDRRTGGLSRDLERGVRAITSLLNFIVFAIAPTLVELVVVTVFLIIAFGPVYAALTLLTIAAYFWFTWSVTHWRTQFRVQMNEMESKANTDAVDALLNFETVKYFGNERFESDRYDASLTRWENAAVKSQTTLAALNIGQGVIIAIGITLLMYLATRDVTLGRLTLGDFVMLNAFLIQLSVPLSFLGTVVREVNHSLTDTDRMFSLLENRTDVTDSPQARTLHTQTPPTIAFENVSFSYRSDRPILKNVSFDIPAGNMVAVVGPSGSGKSTLARLLFRFYDVDEGRITVHGHDIRDLKIASLRQKIGVVPQDTVLFNDTIGYNIRYGNTSASADDVRAAAGNAFLDTFIGQLPDGYETTVGERGLKVSGGEKQRIAIARTMLKDPPILILDEATSALDSTSERAIQAALDAVAQSRTGLVISHRLSTIVNADEIIVLVAGEIEERGRHDELLAHGAHYFELWEMQQREEDQEPNT